MEHRLISTVAVAQSGIPTRYLSALAGNEALNPCCRDVFKHSVEYYQTREGMPEREADKVVIVCGCGRRHVRVVVTQAV